MTLAQVLAGFYVAGGMWNYIVLQTIEAIDMCVVLYIFYRLELYRRKRKDN